MTRNKKTVTDTPTAETNNISPSHSTSLSKEADKFEAPRNDCAHTNTEVRNYDKETGVGELWCKGCGSQLDSEYEVK